MRLRGPWIVRGLQLDTSTSSVNGTLVGYAQVEISMSAYSFYPDAHHSRTGTLLWKAIPYGTLGSAEPDNPSIVFKNQMSSNVSYKTAWRHINP